MPIAESDVALELPGREGTLCNWRGVAMMQLGLLLMVFGILLGWEGAAILRDSGQHTEGPLLTDAHDAKRALASGARWFKISGGSLVFARSVSGETQTDHRRELLVPYATPEVASRCADTATPCTDFEILVLISEEQKRSLFPNGVPEIAPHSFSGAFPRTQIEFNPGTLEALRKKLGSELPEYRLIVYGAHPREGGVVRGLLWLLGAAVSSIVGLRLLWSAGRAFG